MARSAIYPPSVQPGLPEEWPLPSLWQWTSLANLIEVVERAANIQDDCEYQLVTAKRNRGGIVARERLLGKQILTKSQFVVEQDDFVISRRQIIHGACGVVPESLSGAVVSNEYATLRVLPALELEYLRLLSYTPYFQKTCFQSSMGVDVEKMVFKLERWLTFRLPLPPIPEQRRIATALAIADHAVNSAESVLAQAETLKRGVMDQLLTRGIPGKHKRFVATDIGDLPHGWSVLPLEALADVNRGKFSHRPRNEPRLYGGATPFVQTGDVAGVHGWRLETHEQTLSDEGVPFSRVFPAGSLLVTIAANIGRVALTTYPVACPDSLVAVQPKRQADAYWLLAELHRRQPELERCAPQNAQKNINLEVLRPLQIPVPPEDEREMIGRRYHELQETISLATRSAEQLRLVRTGLLHDLVTGRVRVPR